MKVSPEQKQEFAAIFGYTSEDQIVAIETTVLDGQAIVTLKHSYRTDEPITFKEREVHPAKVVAMQSTQYLIKGTENTWVIEHTLSRFMSPEELAKCQDFSRNIEDSNEVEDAKIVTH